MELHLHQEINNLESKIKKMFAMTEQALEGAIQALMERDDEVAQIVLQGDRRINKLEVAIEEDVLNILALRQPVARDLRFIVGCSNIANELERIGDQAANIAERVVLLNRKPKLPFMNSLQALADVAQEMFKKIIKAFMDFNTETARDVLEMDNEADDLNEKIIKILIDYMANESVVVERAVHTIIVANALERVADHCTNIGEEVVFIKQGVNVKHSDKFDKV